MWNIFPFKPSFKSNHGQRKQSSIKASILWYLTIFAGHQNIIHKTTNFLSTNYLWNIKFRKAISNNVIIKYSRVPNACPNTTMTVLNRVFLLNCTSAETHAIQISPSHKANFQLDFNHFHLKIVSPFVRKTPDFFPVSMKPIHLNQWKCKFFRSTCARACPHGQPCPHWVIPVVYLLRQHVCSQLERCPECWSSFAEVKHP